MKPSQFKDIGQYLRESRESLNIPIDQAANALHIRVKYLEALELGDLKDMPGKAYIRGYIRNYADYLRVNPAEVLDAYAQMLGPKQHPELFIPEPTLQQNLPTRALLWFSLIGLFILYACWYLGFHDRGTAGRKVPQMPWDFVHLLDKNPPPAMDMAWKECLSESGEAGCYILLRERSLYMPDPRIYDLDTTEPHTTSRKPKGSHR